MTNTRPDPSLSPIEIIVLSRLSCARRPSDDEIAGAVAELALKPNDGNAHAIAQRTLESLRNRVMIQGTRDTLTEAGRRALQIIFKMNKAPSWKDIHVWHLLAHVLKLQPGTEETFECTKDAEDVARIALRAVPRPARDDKSANKLLVKLFGLSSSAHSLTQIRTEIADAIIRERLGLVGQVSVFNMRMYALAREANGGAPPVIAGSKAQMLQKLTENLGEPCKDKRSLRNALVRHWVYENQHTRTVNSSRATSGQGTLPLPTQGTGPIRVEPVTQPSPPPSLLQTVRDTLPRIGADGRFGPEKVFISALWQRLDRERAVDLPLDSFKTWLIVANREQQLDLVRADLVGAMDPKLVAESEIEDLGATFHFVVDRQATNQRRHA